ncbi:MAG TPA: hypothetical protein VGW38_13170 [Chloroflexota bacterium]|nr:hypothetical protein [Chloroflexota bacterium]
MPRVPESFTRALSAAHAEALRVGDSPLRADQLAAKLAQLLQELARLEVAEDLRERLRGSITKAEQTLRRDDDGAQAARHLKEAKRLGEPSGSEARKAPWE